MRDKDLIQIVKCGHRQALEKPVIAAQSLGRPLTPWKQGKLGLDIPQDLLALSAWDMVEVGGEKMMQAKEQTA